MTSAQRAYLLYLATGDRLHLFEARVTALTADACLRRGWTREIESGGYNGREITGAGRTALLRHN